MPPHSDHATLSAILAQGLESLIGPDLPVDAVGFSFGGVVMAYLAAQHPALIRRLVIVDSGGLDTPPGEIHLSRVRGLKGAEREAAGRANLLGLMLHAPESVDALALYLAELNGFRGRLRAAPLVLPDRLLAILPQVQAQVDAIWGEHDRAHPNPAVQESALRQILPEIDFRVVKAAGHWVMYERASAFNATLLDLLGQPLR